MSLHYIRRDGSGLRQLTGWMYLVTNLTASPDGQYLLFSAKREDTSGDHHIGWPDLGHLYVADVRSGEIFTLTSGIDFSEERGGAWSPDGQRIAFVALKENVEGSTAELDYHLCVINRDGTGKECLLERDSIIWTVAWSPTGERILFEQGGAIWLVRPDGSGLFKVADAPIEDWRPYTAQPAWSPDGRRIAFVAPGVGGENNADVFVVNADGSGLINLTEHPAYDFQPVWSPDGQRIAFVTARLGRKEWAIYVMDANRSDCRQVFYDATWAARDPTWSPDGSQIVLVGMLRAWEERLFITDLAGSSRLLNKEYIGDRPAWVLMPTR